MRRIAALLIATLSLAISACTGPVFKGDVTRYHRDLPTANGATVRVVSPDKFQNSSIEFEVFSRMAADHLATLGYRPTDESPADLTGVLDYSISLGREKIINRPYSHISSGYNLHHECGTGSYGDYFWGTPYWAHHRNNIVAQTVYTATLRFSLLKGDPDAVEGSQEVLFEGTVTSEGREKHMAKLMTYMLQALFDRFPGENGEIGRFVIDPRE